MAVLGVSRFEAGWMIPAVTLYRMQKAHAEYNGEEQKWAKSRLDKITELMHQDGE